MKHVTLPNLRELLNARLEQLEQLPCNAEELDAIHILVDDEFAKFIYDPIIHQKQHPEYPSWCVAFCFVDLLKYVFRCKEWVNTMDRKLMHTSNNTLPCVSLCTQTRFWKVIDLLKNKGTKQKRQKMMLNKAAMTCSVITLTGNSNAQVKL